MPARSKANESRKMGQMDSEILLTFVECKTGYEGRRGGRLYIKLATRGSWMRTVNSFTRLTSCPVSAFAAKGRV